MRYGARFGILFVMTLFASRVSPGILVEEHWYFFFWALFVAGLNAAIRSTLRAQNWSCSWAHVTLCAIILNFFLYAFLAWGAVSWLGITANTFGSAMLAAFIVAASSAICNHFIARKKG